MRILSDYSLEYGVSNKGSNVFRLLSAIFGMIGVVSIIPAIAYSYYFFIAFGMGIALWLLFEEMMKKGEYTIRLRAEKDKVSVSKITLDGKEIVLREIKYGDIKKITIVNETEEDINEENFVNNNDPNGISVELEHNEKTIMTMDKYMFSVVSERTRKNDIS